MAHGRRRRGHEGGHENAERWLLTYADLITLLMVFFVVLYSMSSADQTKWKQISAALQQAFNTDVLRGTGVTTPTDGTNAPSTPVEQLISSQQDQSTEVARLTSRIQQVVQNTSDAPDVSVGSDREGVVIRLSGSFLFDSGRADLKPNALPLLDAVAAELRPLPNDVRVEGHTDSIPIDSPRYPTNWELSAARALSVTRYLTEVDGLQAGRLMAAGLGEFHPLAPNDTREHRALNRRVEIHLLSSSSTSVEHPQP